MQFGTTVYRLRVARGLTQEVLAEALGVSHQAVQKWESGSSMPDLQNVMKVSRFFNVSVDALLFGSDGRIVEELVGNKQLLPDFSNAGVWDVYSKALMQDLRQSVEEGLDVERYRDLFEAVSKLAPGEHKERLSETLFDLVSHAPRRSDFAYAEPSTLAEIQALRAPYSPVGSRPNRDRMEQKLLGAWTGRAAGCLLGKPIEGIRTDELDVLLRESGNKPMHRYIRSTDVTEQMASGFRYRLTGRPGYADRTDGMPVDDDINYTVMAQELIERFGRDFTPSNVASIWLSKQTIHAYCTAERVAYRNLIKGYCPPTSALYQNPYREWIGAQIRGDYYGYINPGDPETAADMAFRDASISHIKNGIYGEMFVSAILATAAVTDSVEEAILGGLGQIPKTSRLYEAVWGIVEDHRKGVSQEKTFASIHRRFDEHNEHDWCHTISNAAIVTAALLYGNGDFGRSICMAVETGFDTDCNGATVGSILGMLYGIQCIGEEWKQPLNGKLHTSLFGTSTVRIEDCVRQTLLHAGYKEGASHS